MIIILITDYEELLMTRYVLIFNLLLLQLTRSQRKCAADFFIIIIVECRHKFWLISVVEEKKINNWKCGLLIFRMLFNWSECLWGYKNKVCTLGIAGNNWYFPSTENPCGNHHKSFIK